MMSLNIFKQFLACCHSKIAVIPHFLLAMLWKKCGSSLLMWAWRSLDVARGGSGRRELQGSLDMGFRWLQLGGPRQQCALLPPGLASSWRPAPAATTHPWQSRLPLSLPPHELSHTYSMSSQLTTDPAPCLPTHGPIPHREVWWAGVGWWPNLWQLPTAPYVAHGPK